MWREAEERNESSKEPRETRTVDKVAAVAEAVSEGRGCWRGKGGGEVTPPQTDTRDTLRQQATGDQQTSSNSNSNAFNSYSNINSNRTNPSFNFIPRQNKAGPSNSSGSGSASNSNQGYNNSNTNYGRGDYGNNRYGNNSGDNLSSN